MSRAGWLTLHEVLEVTELPYRDLMALIEQGDLTQHTSGAAKLFDPADVERFTKVDAGSSS